MAAHLTKVTVKGFKKCCISNAMDGSDGEEEEGTDCEDADSDTDWER
jgi:hypothetical protein